MFGTVRIPDFVIAIFAAIGLITVLGVVGMAVMHVSMMHGMRSCSEALHL